MRRLLLLVCLLAFGGTFTAQAQSAPIATQSCLELTTRTGLDTKRITNGLGLTGDQVRELRGRLATYFGYRPFTLEGLGLTAEQTAEVKRRIAVQVAAMNAHPLGWPCAPFKNASRVITYMKAKLVYNGFRPAMTVRVMTSRQIRIVAILDGDKYIVNVAKYGPRQIKAAVSCASAYCSASGGLFTFNLSFDA